MQIKAARYHLTPVKMSPTQKKIEKKTNKQKRTVEENVIKGNHTVGGNVN